MGIDMEKPIDVLGSVATLAVLVLWVAGSLFPPLGLALDVLSAGGIDLIDIRRQTVRVLERLCLVGFWVRLAAGRKTR